VLLGRRNHRCAAWLGLFAIWLQVVVALPHVCPDDIAALAGHPGLDPEIISGGLDVRDLPLCPLSDGRAGDTCFIYATVHPIAEERPDAIFAVNNLMAIGALCAIAAAGLSCPGDIAVACFDDFEWAEVCEPRITTVAQPTQEIGRAAVSLLFERIRGTVPKAPRRVVLPTRLIGRTMIADRTT
jgi:substrate-binding family protein